MRVFLAIAAALILLTAGRYQPRRSSGAAQPFRYPYRFAYLTDIHCRWLFGGSGIPPSIRNDYQLGEVVDTLNTLGADLIVIGGDWAEDVFEQNNAANADSFSAKLARFNGVILPCMGNHEAIGSDTLLLRNPYYTSQQRFPSKFQGNNWYKYDHKNIRFIALQNNTNYDTDAPSDYRINNPTTYAAPTGGITGYDYDGITNPSSPQRLALASYTRRTDVGERWVIPFFHRAIYGCNSNADSRHNFGRAARGTGYMKAIEDSLPTGRRGIALFGDQHLPWVLTNAIADSALASATGKGLHHVIVASGAGPRSGDSTSVPIGFHKSYMYLSQGSSPYTTIAGATTGAIADTFTTAGDPCITNGYTWALFTVYGDVMMVEVFRVWTTCQANQDAYTGAGSHLLVHRDYIRRDVD